MCLLDDPRKEMKSRREMVPASEKEKKRKAEGKWFRLDMKWKLPKENGSGGYMVHVWPPWVLTEACL